MPATYKSYNKNGGDDAESSCTGGDDKDMIASVHETDLIAKEFQKHEKCYREYTKIVRESVPQSKNDEDDPYGNIDVALSIIERMFFKDNSICLWKPL